MTTETIDKLYLELSQFTTAKTKRELALYEAVSLLNSMVESGESHSKQSREVVNRALNFGYASDQERMTLP